MPIFKVKDNDLWKEVLNDLTDTDEPITVNNIGPDTMNNIQLDKSHLGIFVTKIEPTQVTDGDIWIDTSGTPAENNPKEDKKEDLFTDLANLYVWKRNEGLEDTYLTSASAVMNIHSWGVSESNEIIGQYTDSISVIDNFIYLVNPSEVTFSDAASYEVTKGKYLYINSTVYKISEEATFTQETLLAAAVPVGYYIKCNNCQICTAAGGYVSSHNRNAYPDNDSSYKYLGQLGSALELIANNEEDDSESGTTESEIPYYDFVALGLDPIPVDGTEISFDYDTTELREVLSKKSVKIRFQTIYNSTVYTYTRVIDPTYCETLDLYQLIFMGVLQNETKNIVGVIHFDIPKTGIKIYCYSNL